jgi:putative ABC transport system permease protein
MSASATSSFGLREYGSALTVTGLSALFGSALMGTNTALVSGMRASGADALGPVKTMLDVIAWLFLGIALFIGAVVTVNTFGTIIAGRAKRLALLRLLGASGRSLRRGSLREGLAVGVTGSLVGTIAGAALVQGAIAAGHQWWKLYPGIRAPWFVADMIAPAIAAVLVTVLSAWIGSRRILRITPVQAFGTAQAATESAGIDRRTGRASAVAATVLVVIGAALLALGALSGIATPMGVLIALPGGILTFIAFMLTADRILPPLLQVGGSLAHGAAGRLAARNTSRNPKRSTRSTLGVVIGVALITMFAVAGLTYREVLVTEFTREYGGTTGQMQQAYDALSVPVSIVMGLVGFSVLISVIGLVNSLTLSTLQRRTEIGLLRALGLTRRQVRLMTFVESLRMTVTATVTGLVIGIAYGWLGSVSMLGSLMKPSGDFWPVIPWQLVVGVAIGSLLVTTAAALAASRRAVAVSPIVALAQD